MQYSFDWDPKKASLNHNKHGISFEEAVSVFKDPRAISIFDKDHNDKEDRWVTLGLSFSGRLLTVVHTFKNENASEKIIRIISCRKATKKEIKTYTE